ncbi:hypothetical protein GobsT_30890 [Gemmata obscuriglobus]|uniref:Uncharacterized protein n=1 Tax=Gemmata obscuriglobus TaxID=114 RepID=A0A2Z3GWA6_9BACT|nr:hypothetical protein [Gemmata obscuriglobus]AWM38719.1 hypothetical protein C1280_18135 [Gemmata obscuriglobus]QEG28312.1 hypothetical protein GobsT_30890 [Gemmata obscuriglobus]VTS06161.1 unnamed protein product [Gemmata obscuriglobus UQM 2246]
MKCELTAVSKDEAYRVLRELVLRMDLTATEMKTAQDPMIDQYKWAVAIDKILGAIDNIK